MRSALPRVAGLLAVVAIAVAVVALASGSGEADTSQASAGEAAQSARVTFHADAVTKNERILNLGGLVIRASCLRYQGREYLSVGAKTLVNNTARAVVLSQQGSDPQTYSFKSSDFDRSYGWYDFTGSIPESTTGTLSYARPDGGQVAVTFRADQDTPKGDCTFDGTANYLP